MLGPDNPAHPGSPADLDGPAVFGGRPGDFDGPARPGSPAHPDNPAHPGTPAHRGGSAHPDGAGTSNGPGTSAGAVRAVGAAGRVAESGAPAVRIPVLALSAATGDDLVAALRRTSCVFLTGIPSFTEHLDAVLETSRDFFGLDPAEKGEVRWSGEGPWEGWQPVYEDGPDALLLERFEIALPHPGGFASTAGWAASFAAWPRRPAGMATAWAAYYGTMRTVIDDITARLVDALGLPAADLPAWTTRQHSNLCVNHYLSQPDPPAPGQVRQRPHTDMGGLTLLWADGSAGGLEARIGPDGGWVPVSFPAGAVLLQAGDLLARWTHGRIPANDHRVVNPPRRPGAPQTDRYSVVFFHHPDLDTWVAPADAEPADAERSGIGAREHVLARQRAAYTID